MLGSGPFSYSDPDGLKTPVQRRVEADLVSLLDQVVSADFPFLGACYGIGALTATGRRVDRRFASQSEPSRSTTPAGRRDPLLRKAARSLQAFTGHKEAVSSCRARVLLARSGLRCRRSGRRQRLRDTVSPGSTW